MRSRFLRVACCFLFVPFFCLLAYLLSFGPASAWVADTISGQPASKLDLAKYDARLISFYHFYGPLIEARTWLYWRISPEPEHLLYRYEGLFARPAKLADGRVVFTNFGYSGEGDPRPGESATDYVHRLGDPSFPATKPGTAVYKLPRSGRILVILDPAEDETSVYTVFRASIEDDVATGTANLR